MPMPQRNSRRVAQLLSNNTTTTSLLSGSGASGIATAASRLSNYINSGSNNNNSNNNNNNNINSSSSSIISPSSNNSGNSGTSSNGRLYGNPAVAAAAAAAAASASALTSISAASAHHHQPPPLITDTLTACLDVNGTYICTSYSPRCYIIQKVTPNTVTVTPHLIGSGEGGTTTGVVTGSSPHVVGPSHLLPILPSPSSSSSSAPSTLAAARKLCKHSCAGEVSLSSSASSPSHHHHHHHQHLLSSSVQASYSSSSTLGSQRHFHHGCQHSHRSANYVQTPRKSGAVDFVDKTTAFSSSSRAYSSPSVQSSRAYMNGEAGSTTATFVGEESTPTMVHQSSNSSGAGTQISETRTLNGVKDGSGMSREHMKAIESNEIEGAEISRRGDPGNGANPTSSDLSREELKRQLLQQLEYYFSPENLANDKFLVSQMDSDHYVLISTIADFNLVKRLTRDIDLVTEALRDSKNVQVHSDGKRVRPVSHRTVVILRGIPESTPVEEIKALFDSENCPKCNSCEFAFNDSWYISFESDEDAQRAHRYLREDVKEFKGQPIMARIKSRPPTTLLAQGAGVHLKNGYHQPPPVGYMSPAAFVPGSQTGPTAAVAPAPMYAHGQTVPPPVFPIPPNYASYGPWTYNYGMGEVSQMFPLNGVQPAPHSSSTYPKPPMTGSRPRNMNPPRGGRRPAPVSSIDTQGINGVVGAGGTTSAVTAHQNYGNPPRKSTGPPQALMTIVPNTPTNLPMVNPASHNHSQGHLPHSSVQVGGNAISQNGSRHYGGNLQSSLEPYGPPVSMRSSYHRNNNESRPKSRTDSNKVRPRREDEGSYDGPSASPSLPPNKVPSARGAPPSVPTPQSAPVENLGPQQPSGKMNFDLGGSAFPPLPGSGQSAGKNGDAVFEGRLSDVVKGVKSVKVSSSEKDDAKPTSGNASTETTVSAEENQGNEIVREVSAASPPIKDLEEKKPEHSSSQSSVQAGKKEFREVGVGSADDTHDIRSSHYKSSVVGGARNKETADKSTRTDEALLNGDQPPGMKTGSTQTSMSQTGGSRRSVAQSTTSKSPTPGKRTVPGSHGQNASSTVSVGPDVPYHPSRAVTSPVTSPTKPAATQISVGSGPGSNSASSSGRGANAYVAKTSGDNNTTRANGMVSSNSGSNLVDKDAFPSPGFGKSVPTSKPFPNSNDQTQKEGTRTTTEADKDRKESGQGDVKKNEDCSSEERDGPVRLSYAQVAQARKETSNGGSNNNSQQASAQSVGNCVNNSSNSASAAQSSSEDKKKPNPKDTKDVRPPQRNQTKGGGGGERDGRYGRRYRNRMTSDHSDGGGSGPSGGEGRRPAKPSRSPK